MLPTQCLKHPSLFACLFFFFFFFFFWVQVVNITNSHILRCAMVMILKPLQGGIPAHKQTLSLLFLLLLVCSSIFKELFHNLRIWSYKNKQTFCQHITLCTGNHLERPAHSNTA